MDWLKPRLTGGITIAAAGPLPPEAVAATIDDRRRYAVEPAAAAAIDPAAVRAVGAWVGGDARLGRGAGAGGAGAGLTRPARAAGLPWSAARAILRGM